MRFNLVALVACCIFSASAYGQISANFSTGTGFVTGDTGFTLFDATTPGFDATFAPAGEVVFFNNNLLYNGSNRAFAVDGGQSSTITFSGLADVTVFAQDSNGQVTGGLSTTVPGGTTLGIADGTIEAFDASNVSLGVFTLGEAGFTSQSFIGASSLELINAGGAGSFSVLGSIEATASVTAVPEPSSMVVLGLFGLALVRRKRS